MAWLRFLLVAVALSFATGAEAQPVSDEPIDPTADERARTLFEEALVAYNGGDYERSLRYFEDAYQLSGRSVLLFNIGTSADRLRLNQKALESFEAYLAALPDAENRSEVEARVRVLRQELARQAAIESSLQSSQSELAARSAAEQEQQALQSTRRRRRMIGGIAGGLLLVGAVVLTAVLVSGDNIAEPFAGGVRVNTLRSRP